MAAVEVLPVVWTPMEEEKQKNSLSSFVKGGAGLMLTALVDMTVAFCTVYWATWSNKTTGENGGYGLWMMWDCSIMVRSDGVQNIQEFTVCQNKWADTSFPAWYVTTQVLMTLGLAGMYVSFILLLLYICTPNCARTKAIMTALIAVSYLSGLFIMIGLSVFGARIVDGVASSSADWFLSWSFSLACTAFVLNAISASILVTETKRIAFQQNPISRSPIYRPVIPYTKQAPIQTMLIATHNK